MTRTFNSLEKFHQHLQRVVSTYPRYEKRWGEFCAEMLEKEARDKVGHRQEGWQDLADSTKADKERLGYVFNTDYNPLYREGDLRDSIKGYYSAVTCCIYLGSTSMIAYWQTIGTPTIPPRDVIGSTMMQAIAVMGLLLKQMFLVWLKLEPLQLRRQSHGVI